MEGILPAEELVETWGAAAEEARRQADQVIFYRSGKILNVTIVDVRWELGDCRMVGEPSPGQAAMQSIAVKTSETWIYEADLRCSSGALPRSLWVDIYPAETYVLSWTEGEWQIVEWDLGAQDKLTIDYWKCP